MDVRRTIEIDLTEDDCEMLNREVVYKGHFIEWVYRTTDEDGEEFIIRFIPYKGEE